MTNGELIAYLTEGLDETNAAALRGLLAHEKVAAKAGNFRQKSELDAIQASETALRTKLDGDGTNPGAAAYQKWYGDNFAAITKASNERALYEQKYGALDGSAPRQAQAAPAVDEASIQRMVDARIQGQYGPQWSNLLKGSGRLIEKHMRSGRKQEIDWDKISEIAATKGGDLVQAYDEWDKPEREKANTVAEDARVEARVKQELEKRSLTMTATRFPAGADASPSDSPLAKRGAAAGVAPAYNRQAVLEAAATGRYNGFKDNGSGGRPGADFFKQ